MKCKEKNLQQECDLLLLDIIKTFTLPLYKVYTKIDFEYPIMLQNKIFYCKKGVVDVGLKPKSIITENFAIPINKFWQQAIKDNNIKIINITQNNYKLLLDDIYPIQVYNTYMKARSKLIMAIFSSR